MRLGILLLSLVFVLLSGAHAYAQNQANEEPKIGIREIERWSASVDKATQGYENEFIELKRSKKRFFKGYVRSLRAMYPRVRYYTPFAEDLIKDMERYAFIVDTSDDNVAVNDALFKYNELLDRHIVNLDVLAFAIKMTDVNIKLGQAPFLKKIQTAIHNELVAEGVERTWPDRAHMIVTSGEEDYLLEQYGGTLKGSEIYHVNGQYYNVHDIEKDGEEIQMYMNVTRPIKNMLIKVEAQKRERSVNIP